LGRLQMILSARVYLSLVFLRSVFFLCNDISGHKLTRKELFRLPNLRKDLLEIRDDIVNGKGFVLFRNLPVTEWGLQKSATAYMGLGTYFGYFTAQNGRGHVLGHVKDLSSKADPNDKTVSPTSL
jgi:hypothetical protein